MWAGDQKGERTMAQECLIFLMALIVTFAICDCLQIISFKSRYKIEKSQSRHLRFLQEQSRALFNTAGGKINAILDLLCLFKEKLRCSCLPGGLPARTYFFNQQGNFTRSQWSILFVVSGKPGCTPLPVLLVFSPNGRDGWRK